ncbi:hypothetical protein LSH36_2452g00001, partial [Paralvinella palmiformis]
YNSPECSLPTSYSKFKSVAPIPSECSRDTCLSGCDTSLPSGYNWIGSSCQIGNVGLNKPTNMTAADFYQKTYPATGAVDANDDDILQQFYLTVYNTSDNELLCGYHHDPVFTHITITCDRPLIDCTLCLDSVICNDVTGCEACQGSYQPECKQRCEDGFYGKNCQDQCGQCKTNTLCDSYNGICHDGCQIWWTDTKCNTYISLPNRTDEILTLLNKTSNSIEIRWQHIRGISPDIIDFYGYLIQYKNGLPNATYIRL